MVKILVDIDDTLMPWFEPVDVHCRARLGLTEPARQWKMHEDYGVPLERWLELVSELVVPDGLYHTPPYPGDVEAMRTAYFEGGWEFYLVTARGFMDHAEQIREWTTDWVEEWAVPGELIFAKDKDRVAIEKGIPWAVDDGAHNYDMLDAAGVNVYLRNQPHNQDRDDIPPHRRVDSVAEFLRLVDSHEALAKHFRERYVVGLPA